MSIKPKDVLFEIFAHLILKGLNQDLPEDGTGSAIALGGKTRVAVVAKGLSSPSLSSPEQLAAAFSSKLRVPAPPPRWPSGTLSEEQVPGLQPLLPLPLGADKSWGCPPTCLARWS